MGTHDIQADVGFVEAVYRRAAGSYGGKFIGYSSGEPQIAQTYDPAVHRWLIFRKDTTEGYIDPQMQVLQDTTNNSIDDFNPDHPARVIADRTHLATVLLIPADIVQIEGFVDAFKVATFGTADVGDKAMAGFIGETKTQHTSAGVTNEEMQDVVDWMKWKSHSPITPSFELPDADARVAKPI